MALCGALEDLRFDFPADRVYRAADGQELTDELEFRSEGAGARDLPGGSVSYSVA